MSPNTGIEGWVEQALLSIFKAEYDASAVELGGFRRTYRSENIANEVGLLPDNPILKPMQLTTWNKPKHLWGFGVVLKDNLIQALASCGYTDRIAFSLEVVYVGTEIIQWSGIDLKKSAIDVFLCASTRNGNPAAITQSLIDAFESERILAAFRQND